MLYEGMYSFEILFPHTNEVLRSGKAWADIKEAQNALSEYLYVCFINEDAYALVLGRLCKC